MNALDHILILLLLFCVFVFNDNVLSAIFRFNIILSRKTYDDDVKVSSIISSSFLNNSTSSSSSLSPVIGILSQPWNDSNITTVDYHYIAASYVKWIEAGGARSIPIPYDADEELLDDLLTQIHGLLLPGGGATIPHSVHYILNQIVHNNNNNTFFPVWGTCLGFEFLIQHFGGDSGISTGSSNSNVEDSILQSGFESENISLPLEYVQSKYLYNDLKTYYAVTRNNITMNNHYQGIEPQTFLHNTNLIKLWKITSINHDLNNRPFVSTIEPHDIRIFPFFGVQYHPEKNAFEYGTHPGTNIPYEAIDHSPIGIEFSLYLSRFFVNLARNNIHANYSKSHYYPLIQSYPIHHGIEFEQIYIIPHANHWKR